MITLLTATMMRTMWPHGNDKIPGLREGIAAAAPTIFPRYGLTSDLLVAHAMAQFSHECGAGLEMVENVHYSVARAAEVWPGRFADASAVYRVIGSSPGDPDFSGKLIDSVYGHRMGNHPGTHDGRNFIGRGLSQTTGREGYEKLAARTGLDVVNHPELVALPANALECGVADFVLCGCLPFAVNDDVVGVTKHLNGGLIGLAERQAWLSHWKTALVPTQLTGTAWVQDALNKLGAIPQLTVDGELGPKTTEAIKVFQKKNKLMATGLVTSQLTEALDKALTTKA